MSRPRRTGSSPRRELERFFCLDDVDRALIGKRRGDQIRCGHAVTGGGDGRP
ncbi:DUF4158 domain-containing protein [Streptomyces sp. MCAF7]